MCSDIAILIELWSNPDQKSTGVAVDLKTRATLRVAADTAYSKALFHQKIKSSFFHI